MHKIMDVVLQIRLEVGLSGASIETVINKGDVTRSTFFYHFKNKHDLAAASIDRTSANDRDITRLLVICRQFLKGPL